MPQKILDNQTKIFWLFLLTWVIIDLTQAFFMEIHADEAYYALYGNYLDWGYFDHPPLIGLICHLSSILFSGNLSVRFLTTLLHAATIVIIWKTINDRNATQTQIKTFFAISASMVMFVAYGFITTPDAPLLFFTSAFLYQYKQYLKSNTWTNATLIAIYITGMLYSKYMAILVVLFVLLSNIKLIFDKRLWYSIILASILFSPHIIWQIKENFPSFSYHLVERNNSFSWVFPLEYIPNQLIVFNPLLFFVIIYWAIKDKKTTDLFEKACIYLIIGFIGFFWIMTIKGHAEPHWTVAASIPIICLSYKKIAHTNRENFWTKKFILPIVFLIIIARIILCFDILPTRIGFNGKKSTYEKIYNICKETPVIFIGSFQKASLYRFFNQKEAMALSSLGGRYTQFDILQLETELQGKEAYIFRSTENIEKTHNLQTVNRVHIEVNEIKQINNDSINLFINIFNPYKTDINFAHNEFPVNIKLVWFENNKTIKKNCAIDKNVILKPNENKNYILKALKPKTSEKINICLENSICTSINSESFSL